MGKTLYRIVTDGKEFHVQVKASCLPWDWRDMSHTDGTLMEERSWDIKSFKAVPYTSEQQAEQFAKAAYGSNSERVRSWRIV